MEIVKYFYIFLLLLFISSCGKSPMAPAFDSGAPATVSNNIYNNTATINASNSTIVGDKEGKINLLVNFQNKPVPNATVKVFLNNNSFIYVNTNSNGYAFVSGLEMGVYKTELQPLRLYAVAQCKNVTITNSLINTVEWKDKKSISINIQSYDYYGYSTLSGCNDSTALITSIDPKYYKYGNLSEIRKYNIYYADNGDFTTPLSFVVTTQNGASYSIEKENNSDSGYYKTLTLILPANNSNSATAFNVRAINFGVELLNIDYNFTKNWSIAGSGGTITRAGKINTSVYNVGVMVPSFSGNFNCNNGSPYIAAGYSPYISQYLSGSYTVYNQIPNSYWSGNSLTLSDLVSIQQSKTVSLDTHPAYIYIHNSAGAILEATPGNNATYNQPYIVSIYNPLNTIIAQSTYTFTGNPVVSPVEGINYE